MKEIHGLNWLRGISALLVMLSHARPFFFENYSALSNPTIFDKLFYLVTGLGAEAVMVFFVLSGYLVAGSAHRAALIGHWSWREYLTRRLSRLWAVLLPCLLLTAACDYVGGSILNSPFYQGTFAEAYSSGPQEYARNDSLTFIGNILFLQEIVVPIYGSNGPLWSISYEFWYYVLFPLIMMTMWTARSMKARILNITIFFAVAIVAGPDIIALFPVWLLGFGSWYLRDNRISIHVSESSLAAITAVLIMVIFMLGQRALRLDIPGSEYILGALVAFSIPALHHPCFSRFTRFGDFLSDFSYSLYLTHFPILALLAAAQQNTRETDVLGGLVEFVFWISTCISIALAFHIAFEKRTPQLRKLIELTTEKLISQIRSI